MNPHHEANMAIAQGLSTVKLLAAIEHTQKLTAENMPPPMETGTQRRDWSLATFRFELGRRREAARDWRDVADTAGIFDVSKGTVYQWIKHAPIGATRTSLRGGATLVDINWLKERRNR